jgi:hypothetical protein
MTALIITDKTGVCKTKNEHAHKKIEMEMQRKCLRRYWKIKGKASGIGAVYGGGATNSSSWGEDKVLDLDAATALCCLACAGLSCGYLLQLSLL